MRGNKMNDKPGTLCCWRRAFAGASYDYREILSRRNDLKLEDVVDLFSEMVESGKVEEAWNLFCNLSLEGVKPDVIIYNTMISGICRKGLKEEADALFRKMKEDGPLPDSGTYNTLIRVRLRDSDRAASAELIEEMRSRGFAGDASTIGLVTNMLHDGRLDKSFLEMLS